MSFYEADAFARWAKKRLPKEHEHEHEHEHEVVAAKQSIKGDFLEQQRWRPQVASGDVCGVQQLYGDVWEWTQSSYRACPHFKAEHGVLGEYNGKFMINQLVLKCGSCITPEL